MPCRLSSGIGASHTQDSAEIGRDGDPRRVTAREDLTRQPVGIAAAGDASGLVVGVDGPEQRHLQQRASHARRLETIGMLAAGIAHEINSPIQYVGDKARFISESCGAIRTALGSFRDALVDIASGGADPVSRATEALGAASASDLSFYDIEVPTAIRESIEGIDRVVSIARAMRDFAHPGHRERRLVDVNDIVSKAVALSRNEWKYVAELRSVLCDDLPPVLGVAGDLSQVVLNLVVSAAQAIEQAQGQRRVERGQILVSTSHDAEAVVIRVVDTGAGIRREHIDRICDPFLTTKDVGKGTGQGLAIVRGAVVEGHEGDQSHLAHPA